MDHWPNRLSVGTIADALHRRSRDGRCTVLAVFALVLACACHSSAPQATGLRTSLVDTADRLRFDVAVLASDACGGRAVGTPGIALARDHIAIAMASAGLEPGVMILGDAGNPTESAGEPNGSATGTATYLQPLEGRIRQRMLGPDATSDQPWQGHNVIGHLPGQGRLASEVIVVLAHYDHLGMGQYGGFAGSGKLHPGADDNASGVAVMLEAARLLVASTNKQANAVPAAGARRTVVFLATTGEEVDQVGAEAFLDRLDELVVDSPRVIIAWNLDMVGRVSGGNVGLLVRDEPSGQRYTRQLQPALAGLGLRVTAYPLSKVRADVMPFWNRDIPAAMFHTGLHDQYHRPSDTADLLNVDGMARIAHGLAKVVAKQSQAD